MLLLEKWVEVVVDQDHREGDAREADPSHEKESETTDADEKEKTPENEEESGRR